MDARRIVQRKTWIVRAGNQVRNPQRREAQRERKLTLHEFVMASTTSEWTRVEAVCWEEMLNRSRRRT